MHITRATDALTHVVKGPFAIVRGCDLCDFRVSRRRGGKGAGFREGNKQRGLMHAHMKEAHPRALAEVYDILVADGAQSIPPILSVSDLKKLDTA